MQPSTTYKDYLKRLCILARCFLVRKLCVINFTILIIFWRNSPHENLIRTAASCVISYLSRCSKCFKLCVFYALVIVFNSPQLIRHATCEVLQDDRIYIVPQGMFSPTCDTGVFTVCHTTRVFTIM